MNRRGAGLLSALLVGVVIVGLVGVLFVLSQHRSHMLSRVQAQLQARMNAQSLLQQYALQRRKPNGNTVQFGAAGSANVGEHEGDLVFEGRCRGQVCRWLAPGGDPRRARELLEP